MKVGFMTGGLCVEFNKESPFTGIAKGRQGGAAAPLEVVLPPFLHPASLGIANISKKNQIFWAIFGLTKHKNS